METTNLNMPIKNTTNFTTHFVVDKPAHEVFTAINNVKGWWSENIKGNTSSLNDEFLYNYKTVHISKMKIVELIPDKKVVWLVLDNHFDFTSDKEEWKGNRIVFEITNNGGKSRLDFTQEGLVAGYECFDVCKDAWTSYIQGSLKNLIVTGQGKPNTKEDDLNKELIKKWGLPDKDVSDKNKDKDSEKKKNFTYEFNTKKTPEEVFQLLLNIKQWWYGLFDEKIEGKSQQLNDEFSFKAGGGLHFTKQRLIELIPGKKIVWLVTESDLSFLSHPTEWNDTKICFDISSGKSKTKITFTHEGLIPQIECYDQCSSAWNNYLDNLRKKLN